MTPQNWRQVTGIILVVTFVALCVYDVFAVNEANDRGVRGGDVGRAFAVSAVLKVIRGYGLVRGGSRLTRAHPRGMLFWIVLVVSVILLIFAGFIDTSPARYRIGFAFVVLLMLALLGWTVYGPAVR